MDKEKPELSNSSNFPKIIIRFMLILSVFIPVYLIINFNFIPLPLIFSRIFTVYLILIIIYVKNPINFSKKYSRLNILNYLPFILIIVLMIFSYIKIDEMIAYFGMGTPFYQILLGTIGALVLFEGTRRVAGPILPIIALSAIGYALFKGYNYSRIITEIYSYDGIFGFAFALAISVVFMFMIFGCFLNNANFGSFLLKFGNSIVGGMSGGPAKVAVLTSSLFGTVSGSAVANVVGTGTFTIPMMKKLGFESTLAGAIESSASTGGQIMPPVMAAAAFLIAEIIQVPYLQVAKSALLPAIAFYVCVFFSVDSYSKLKGIKGIPKDQRPTLYESLKMGGHLLIVLITLIVFLILKIDPMRAAFLSIILLIPTSFLNKKTRIDIPKIFNSFIEASEGLLIVGACTATVGTIIACIGLTGLGGQIANSIISVGGNNIFFVLLLVMITCIIFGMALPTTASYLVLVSIVGPTMIQLGIVPMGAHLFILYFAALSGITPPIALAAYAGAAIANANMMKTALIACKITIVAFIIPYVFVYVPEMLFYGNSISILTVFLLYVIILPISLVWGIWGYTLSSRAKIYERIFYLLLSFFIIYLSIIQRLQFSKYLIVIWLIFTILSYLFIHRSKSKLIKNLDILGVINENN